MISGAGRIEQAAGGRSASRESGLSAYDLKIKTWMAGTGPAMTSVECEPKVILL